MDTRSISMKQLHFRVQFLNILDTLYDADAQHQFNARENCKGRTSFMPLSELYDPNAGYLVNDTVVVEAEIRLKEEQEEEGKRGDEAKMWLYTIVKVARDEDLAKQIGRDF
ncbi:hypothetical protein ACFX2J_013974 [Malus domestica]